MNYLLVINGKPEGPFSLDELKGLRIKPGDFVKTPEMVDYKEAQEVEELRELFGFKKPNLLIQYYGSFDQRLLADALDWFIISSVGILLIFIVAVFIADKEDILLVGLSALPAIPLLKFIYHVIMECSVKQATLGKLALKIRVCDLDGKRIGFGRALGRNLGKIFSTSMFLIGYLISFFDKRHQCLHDMIAGTLVIKDRLI